MSDDRNFDYSEFPSLVKMAANLVGSHELAVEFLAQYGADTSATPEHMRELWSIIKAVAKLGPITYDDAKIFGGFAAYVDEINDLAKIKKMCSSGIIYASNSDGTVSVEEF